MEASDASTPVKERRGRSSTDLRDELEEVSGKDLQGDNDTGGPPDDCIDHFDQLDDCFESESHFGDLSNLELINDTTITVAFFHFNKHKHIFFPKGTTGGMFLETVFGKFFETCEFYSHLDMLFSILDYQGWEHKQDLYDLFIFINNFSLTPTYLKNNAIIVVRFGSDPIKQRMRIKEIIKDSIYVNSNSSAFNSPSKPSTSPSSPVTSPALFFSRPANISPEKPDNPSSSTSQLSSASTTSSGSALSSENTSVSLDMRLQKLRSEYNGLRVISGDGNCYFRAVLYSHVEFVVSGSIQNPTNYSRVSIEFLAEFFEHLTPLISGDTSSHIDMIEVLKAAATYEHWMTLAELQEDFLNKVFDHAIIRACRLMLSVVYLMLKDIKINDITIEDVVSAVYDGMTMVTYCEEYIEKMGIEAEGSWVDIGLLPAILNARCSLVYLDPSNRGTVGGLTTKVSEFELKSNVPTRANVKKAMNALIEDKTITPEQSGALKLKYHCMKQFLRLVDPDNTEYHSKSIFRILKPTSALTLRMYDEPISDIFLLFRPGHYDMLYPRSDLVNNEPRHFHTPTSFKFKKKVQTAAATIMTPESTHTDQRLTSTYNNSSAKSSSSKSISVASIGIESNIPQYSNSISTSTSTSSSSSSTTTSSKSKKVIQVERR